MKLEEKKQPYFLAIDLGASSGRVILGHYEKEQAKLLEVHRFSNGPKEENGHLIWDIDYLFNEIVLGIKKAFTVEKNIVSLSIDCWGVDYVLLNGHEVIKPAYCYRDNRGEKVLKEVHERVPFALLYQRTGIQYQPFNTVYQLYSDKEYGRLLNATSMMMLPEYFSYKLTGISLREYTNATTTGLVGIDKEYDPYIIEKLGLDKRFFPSLSFPGALIGKLLPEIEKEVGGNLEVVLCCSHDTASAIEGVDLADDEVFVSSGTWSLIGAKVPHIISDSISRTGNWSNEGGIGYWRYQKNIMGMWPINRLREELCPNMDFSEIVIEASKSTYGESVYINDKKFLAPKSMKEAFLSSLSHKPKSLGDYFKCAFISLANAYSESFYELQRNLGRKFKSVVIVGGGAKNELLNKMIEERIGVKVKALPIEASVLGNIKIQKRRYENE